MAHTYPDAQIHCVFSPKERRDSFSDALREKISMYLIGIGHNQALPILCARETLHNIHLLIAVPRDVTRAKAMQLLKGEFLTLAEETPIRFRLIGESHSIEPQRSLAWSGQTLLGSSARRSRQALVRR